MAAPAMAAQAAGGLAARGRWDGPFAAAMTFGVIAFYAAIWHSVSEDYTDFLQAWVAKMAASDGIAVFATGFAEYTGTYLTLLFTAVKAFDGTLSALDIVKLVSLFGTLLCAVGVWLIARQAGLGSMRALCFALGFMALPTVAQNGVGWGQTDALYAAFVLFGLHALMRDRLALSAAFISFGIAIKLQAIFIGPMLFGLCLLRPRYLAYFIVAIPLAYLASNALFLLAGRPIDEVLSIYLVQFTYYNSRGADAFSLDAPNIWEVLRGVAIARPDLGLDEMSLTMIGVGMTIAIAAALLFAVWVWRLGRERLLNAEALVLLGFLAVLMTVYLLPKMHSRFFYIAEVLAYVMLIWQLRFLWVLIPLQMAILLAYDRYHHLFGFRDVIPDGERLLLTHFAMLAAIYASIKFTRRWLAERRAATPGTLQPAR